MVLSMAGCGDPKEPVIEEPQVVALTEEGALEFVKSLPEGMLLSFDVFEKTASYEQEISSLYQFLGLEPNEIEVDENGNGSIVVAEFQDAIDNMYGKNRFNIAELYEHLIIDGKLVGKVEIRVIRTFKDRTFEIHEVANNYIIVKALVTMDCYVVNNDSTLEDMVLDVYYVIYPTVDGLKVWDIGTPIDSNPEELNVSYPPIAE